jgi:hypothetical protein
MNLPTPFMLGWGREVKKTLSLWFKGQLDFILMEKDG